MDTPQTVPESGLSRLGQSDFLTDLAAAIQTVSEDVARLRQPGSVTVKLKIAPAAGSDIAVIVSETITPTPPVELSKGAHVFVYDGKMYDTDPRIQRLPMTMVERQVTVEEVLAMPAKVEDVS